MAGVLKKRFPDSEIIFLGNPYTRPLIEASRYIDSYLNWAEIANQSPSERLKLLRSVNADIIIHVFPEKEIARLAARSKITIRIGTSRRIYHWFYCNRRVSFTRRGSDLHEAQLNLKLLIPLDVKDTFSLSEIADYYGLTNTGPLKKELSQLLSSERFNLILHPKTKGSAREWGIDNFSKLVEILPEQDYKIFITGTRDEGLQISKFLRQYEHRVVDLTGRMELGELIRFIKAADGLVAASTGPLHIASALGRFALGLYAPMRPIHAGRWGPVGKNAYFLMTDKTCNDCRKTTVCHCIKSIDPIDVYDRIKSASEK